MAALPALTYSESVTGAVDLAGLWPHSDTVPTASILSWSNLFLSAVCFLLFCLVSFSSIFLPLLLLLPLNFVSFLTSENMRLH